MIDDVIISEEKRMFKLVVALVIVCLTYCNAFKMGFAISVDPLATGWTWNHMTARRELLDEYKKLNAPYRVINLTDAYTCDNRCKNELLQFASEDMDLVVLAATAFSSVSNEVAERFPNIQFIQSTSIPATIPSNLNLAYANIEKLRFVTCAYAGLVTKNNKVGYVSELAEAQYARNQVNSCVLGLKYTNPNATLYVINVGRLNNPIYDMIATEELFNKTGVDTFTHHNMYGHSLGMACSLGIPYLFGFGSDQRQFVGNKVLTSNMYDWFPMYDYFYRNIKKNKCHVNNYQAELGSGVIKLAPYSPFATLSHRLYINNLFNQVKNGANKVWCGPAVAAYNPGPDGCITRAQLAKITTFLNGIQYLGTANLTAPLKQQMDPSCWNPPTQAP